MKVAEMFSQRVENTVGKGEIALYQQFLLFQQCFLKTCNETRRNQGLFGKGLSLFRQSTVWHYTKRNGNISIMTGIGTVESKYNLAKYKPCVDFKFAHVEVCLAEKVK